MADTTPHPQLRFIDIHQQERVEIKKRREKQYYDKGELDSPQQNFVGLALSGGGIRSATFCLGFLQELQRLRLLRIFDYVSTVSGGGYVGGWWSAWLSREPDNLRDTDESPLLTEQNIWHASNLLARISESDDELSKELREEFNLDTRLFKPGDPDLREKLAAFLNQYILRPEQPETPPEEFEIPRTTRKRLGLNVVTADSEVLKKQRQASWVNHQRWQKRLVLEEHFPYELRNIFPPREQIEPDRRSGRGSGQDGPDGSLCAWKDPINHLRLFANYLTPRKGILSADTWRAISVIIRNLALTWLILLPLLIGVMLLGQSYFLLNPVDSVRCAFLSNCPNPSNDLVTTMVAVLVPIGILLSWSFVMALAWLLCNRDNSSSLDWIVQTACLIALAALIIAAVLAVPQFRPWVWWLLGDPKDLRSLTHLSALAPLQVRLLLIWLLTTLVSVVLIWNWRLDRSDLPSADAETLSRWKREVRRARFSRAQARLLVMSAIVGAVLLLSWFTCFLTRDHTLGLRVKIPFTILPLLTAIGGSIFTALRATPAANVEKSSTNDPTLVSRLIFAITPGLVVCVLAVLAAWFSHWLLVSLHEKTLATSIYALLDVSAVLIIALCMALAVYEMEDVRWSKVLRISVASILSICLLMVNVSWGSQAIFRYTYTNLQNAWAGLLLASAGTAIVIIAVLFRRVIPRGKWKWRLFRNLEFVKDRLRGSDDKRKHIRALRFLTIASVVSAIMLFLLLTAIGFFIGIVIYFNTTPGETAGRSVGAIVLTLVGLGGGVILFRLLIVRTRDRARRNIISLRLFSGSIVGKRPETLWLVASICLTLPIILICTGHYLHWYGHNHVDTHWTDTPLLFPLSVLLLLASLMILRSLVIQKAIAGHNPTGEWSGGIISWLGGKLPSRIANNQQRAFRVLAFLAICGVSFLDAALRGISNTKVAAGTMAPPVNWTIMALVFFVSLPVFGVSIFQIPVRANLYPLYKSRNRKYLYRKSFLWGLASLCILWAFIAGLLLPSWITHVADIPFEQGLTPLLLPVAAGCFLIVLFEIYWGERDNRRSLLLVAFAYFVVASIFFMSIGEASSDWHIVLGLLASICVWVGALGWMVDPNAVSMHQFYKGRLVRAYLGASNKRRLNEGKEITETVAGDDLPLKALLNCDRGGPYHLINTTLNLVAGRDLATAQRSASSFVLSQRYSGSTRTGYCPTDQYMNGQLSLGTAVAASGAAVSPNMGAKKPTAALAMLMTLLNVRLGYWAPTPNREGWNSSQPRLWPFYLIREFLSQTNDLSNYCYLTDGGHFDNTGLYSLIERGCRYIVLVDCGADPKPSCFQDLGEAIRRCRIDFGTEIDLCLETFIDTDKNKPNLPFVVGTIHFSKEHLRSLGDTRDLGGNGYQARKGTILYFKPSVVENATADVRQYAIENRFFPQQPTTNQWFDEAQFESYRRLGQLCANSAFDLDVVCRIGRTPRLSLKVIDELFSELGTGGNNTGRLRPLQQV